MAISHKTKILINNATKQDLIELAIYMLELPNTVGFEKIWRDRLECLSLERKIDLQLNNPTESRKKDIDIEIARLQEEGIIIR